MIRLKASPVFMEEKAYVWHVLLEYCLGVPLVIEWTDVADYELHTPSGKVLIVEDHFFKQHQGGDYLHRSHIPEKPVELRHLFAAGKKLSVLWGRDRVEITDAGITLGGDLVASTFFLLTRWEEYVSTARDPHGRFPATAAFLYKNGLLDRPLVNEYVRFIENCLRTLGVETRPRFAHSRLIMSHDVDHPQKWRSGFQPWRTVGAALLQRGNPAEAWYWLQHSVFQQQDPYDTFDYLMQLSEAHELYEVFNFMGKRRPDSDCYYPHDEVFVRRLMETIAQRGHHIGFHPSYESLENPALFAAELDSLQKIAPLPVKSGRQHYLRFEAPHTWQMWEDADMELDSTLGYADHEGFRCGICHAFPVFNFLTRRPLKLLEQPVTVMDVTLVNYRHMNAEQAADTLDKYAQIVQEYAGEFVLLWHNSNLDTWDWKNYKPVLQKFVHAYP